MTDHNIVWGILTGWSENILVENNVASRSQVEHGIYISNSADGAVVRNNVVWGNNDSGIQFNADGSLPGDGVHSNNWFEVNVVYDNGRGGGAALNWTASRTVSFATTCCTAIMPPGSVPARDTR